MSDYVTERELAAHLGPINDKLDRQGEQLGQIATSLSERAGARKLLKSVGGGMTLLALVVSAGWWIPALIH